MNALLGLDPTAAPIMPSDLPEPSDIPGFAVLLRAARARNPELAALAGASSGQQAARELAAKRGWPDLSFGVDWILIDETEVQTPESGKDPVALRLGLTLPIWRGAVDSGRRAAAAELAALAARANAAERMIEARLADLIRRHSESRRRIDLHDHSLIPRGRQAIAAAEAAYAAGDVEFGSLLDLRRDLLDFELARARALADLGVVRAEIEELVGGALPAAPTSGES